MDSIDIFSAALRALMLMVVVSISGGALVPLWSRGPRSLPPPAGRGALAVPLAATFVILVHRALDAARLAGEWSGVVSRHLQFLAWSSSAGRASLACLVGVGAIACSRVAPTSKSAAIGVGGAIVVPASFALTGHTTQAEYAAVLRVVLAVHVLLVAFWLGGIGHLASMVRAASLPTLAAEARAFSRHAIWLVPPITLAGVMLVCGLLPTPSAIVSVYGLGIICKALAFSAAIAFASWNRYRAVPALLAGDTTACSPFLRSLRLEQTILLLALTITAVVTTLTGPTQ